MNAFWNYNQHLDLKLLTLFETDPMGCIRDELKETQARIGEAFREINSIFQNFIYFCYFRYQHLVCQQCACFHHGLSIKKRFNEGLPFLLTSGGQIKVNQMNYGLRFISRSKQVEFSKTYSISVLASCQSSSCKIALANFRHK